MLVRKGFSTEVCRDYATRHASNTREGGHQMSLGLVLVPVTSQLCVATINLPCPPKSLSRYYFVPTGKYLPLPHSLSPFRPLLSSRGRVSLSTFPRRYYRDEKRKKFVSERLLLNRTRPYLGERVDWACKRDSPVFWSSKTFVFVPNENKRDERIRKYRISLENGIEVSRRKLLSSNRYWSKELGGKKALPSTSVRNNWTSCSPQL